MNLGGGGPVAPEKPQLEAALSDLSGWHLGTGGGGVSLSKEFVFPTADMGQGFAALAAGLAAVFGHAPAWSVMGRVVTVSLADVERRAVTARQLAFARALNRLRRGFGEALGPPLPEAAEGSLATVLPYRAAPCSNGGEAP